MILGKVRRLSVYLVDNDLSTRLELARVLDSLDIHTPIICSILNEAIDEYLCYTLNRKPNFIISEWYQDFSVPDFSTMFHESLLATIPIIILAEGSRSKPVRVLCEMSIVGILEKPIQRRNLKSILTVV